MGKDRTLRQGAQGDDVRQLQTLLAQAGFDPGPADGRFGPGTGTAVRQLQEAKGLGVDGVVGPATWAALRGSGGQPRRAPKPSGGTGLTPVESPGGGRIKDKQDPAPGDVVTVQGHKREVPLHRLAAEHWMQLVAEARSAGIADPLLLPTSGYRSRASQEKAWARALEKYGSAEAARKWVAPPGNSAHHSGRAIDCFLGMANDSENVETMRRSEAYEWLVANAQRHGFYPYPAEPWHWEYNPPAG